MLKKLLRIVFTIVGAVLGYGLFALIELILTKVGVDVDQYFTTNQKLIVSILFAIIFAFVFFRIAPLIRRQSVKVAEGIGDDLQGVSGNDVLVTTIGLIFGLVIAFLLSQIYVAIGNQYISTALTIVTYLVMGFIGVTVASTKGKEVFSQIFSRSQREQGDGTSSGPRFSVGPGSRRKNSNQSPKILDTSVIIDGRIAEIMKTGFLEGPVVIPEFVLVELRHIADSADSLKRARGRRGLDILNKIQSDYGIEIYNTDSEKALKDIPEVDVKLLKLAQIMNGKVVTNDFNLNKVATINGVDVLNINELANTLKPVVIPGEKMVITPVKEGKDASQSIAYLDDGTMVVVEDGRKEIGKECEITVTSVLQTAAGRMIFGRIKV
ncbi:MAG: PIN domain-containing protein [Firmicutes bacterium]|nr:PIN domain-containing protein [Bacillota bacterium]